MASRVRALLVLPVLALAGCGFSAVNSCPSGLQRTHIAQLFFGRNVGGVEGVGDAEWAEFVDEEVTPRFPDGFSVTDAQGQWRGADGAVVRERSKVLTLVLTAKGDEAEALDAIRVAYKTRFHQEAVLRVETGACVGF